MIPPQPLGGGGGGEGGAQPDKGVQLGGEEWGRLFFLNFFSLNKEKQFIFYMVETQLPVFLTNSKPHCLTFQLTIRLF